MGVWESEKEDSSEAESMRGKQCKRESMRGKMIRGKTGKWGSSDVDKICKCGREIYFD